MKRSVEKKGSKELTQQDCQEKELQSGSECPSKFAIPQIHFSPSGRIRVNKKPSPKPWRSDNSLIMLFQPLKEYELSGSEPSHYGALGRRKSMSMDNLHLLRRAGSPVSPLATQARKVGQVKSESEEAVWNRRGLMSEDPNTNSQASSISSYPSTEVLSSSDIEVMASDLQYHRDLDPSGGFVRSDAVAPEVPERRSAFLENCAVKDDYLIQQGKRLSGLPLDTAATLPTGKGHFKGFVRENVLRKAKKYSSESYSDLTGMLTPPPQPLSTKSQMSHSTQNLQVYPQAGRHYGKTSKSWDDLGLTTHSSSSLDGF